MITICFTYFRSLTLANLRASLYSVSRQDLSMVDEIILVDNNTEDSQEAIDQVIQEQSFPIPVWHRSFKHGDPRLTHAWSTNMSVKDADTEWVLVTRADYLLDFDLIKEFSAEVFGNRFITSHGSHGYESVEQWEQTDWRQHGPRFDGVTFSYTLIDTGVWMARKAAWQEVGGLNENLTAWGHAQTEFQYRLHCSGVEFIKIPRTMYYHPAHGGEKDMELANKQLRDQGIDIQELWARYEGAHPYR